MIKIAALTTCHNREKTTLACLSSLMNQQVDSDSLEIEYYIVDDGCIDNTKSRLIQLVPNINIIDGNGKLYWAGGMRLGWEYIRQKNKPYDYLFVFNDDVIFNPNALMHFITQIEFANARSPHFAISGATKNPTTNQCSYGAWKRSSSWHPLKFNSKLTPNGSLQAADVINMNAAIIPLESIKKVNFLSKYFIHSGADFEFSLKLKDIGGQCYLAPHYIGLCEENPISTESSSGPKNLSTHLTDLFNIKNEPIKQRLKYYKHHGGPIWYILFLSPYLTVFIHFAIERLRAKK